MCQQLCSASIISLIYRYFNYYLLKRRASYENFIINSKIAAGVYTERRLLLQLKRQDNGMVDNAIRVLFHYQYPKYIEHGKKFFEGVNERYTEYAKQLEPKIGIPYTVITPLIFIFVRACVHYAMFEDEYYLKTQMEVLKQGVALFVDKYKANQA